MLKNAASDMGRFWKVKVQAKVEKKSRPNLTLTSTSAFWLGTSGLGE